jgi:hypothetical protein
MSTVYRDRQSTVISQAEKVLYVPLLHTLSAPHPPPTLGERGDILKIVEVLTSVKSTWAEHTVPQNLSNISVVCRRLSTFSRS